MKKIVDNKSTGVKKKQCSRCRLVKNETKFGKYISNKDGRDRWCLLCRQNREISPKARKRINEVSKIWREMNIKKTKAHVKVHSAIKLKKIVKGRCYICNEKKVQAHHIDYNYPLKVLWLCIKHHADYHYKERLIKEIYK